MSIDTNTEKDNEVAFTVTPSEAAAMFALLVLSDDVQRGIGSFVRVGWDFVESGPPTRSLLNKLMTFHGLPEFK